MKKNIRFALVLLFLFLGCSKEPLTMIDGHAVDKNYPATYYTLSKADKETLTNKYLTDKDDCFQGALNDFGFCSTATVYNWNCTQDCRAFNQDKAETMALEFLYSNNVYAGISDFSKLTILSARAFGNSYLCNESDSSLWNLTIGNQVFNDLVVANTGIYLRLDYDGVISATGNWYPFINVPPKENLSYSQALKLMEGKEFDFMCWTNIHLKIDKNTKWEEVVNRKIIYPLNRDQKTELHVVWVLSTGMCSFYVDVMTGELVSAFMNFVC